MDLFSVILTLPIIIGQLIRIQISTGAITLLDFVVLIFCLWGCFKLKLHFKKPPRSISFSLIFILVTVISLILTPLHLSLNDYLTSSFYIIRFSSYVILGWIIYSGGFEIIRKRLVNILLYSGLGIAFLGLLQFIFFPNLLFLSKWGWDPHYFRNISTFLDPNFTGAYLVLTLILLYKTRVEKLKSQFFWLLFFMTYISLLLTFSRSSYLMFLFAGLSLSYLERSKNLLVKVAVLFFVLLLGFQIYLKVISMPHNIDRQQSASLRLSTWQEGLILFQKFPFLGVGFNSYRYALKEYKLGDAEFLSSHGASSNDSSLLFVTATTGLIGLISYLLFVFFIIKEAWGKNLVIISSICGLLIHSCFANSLFYPPILLWIILLKVSYTKN